MDRVQATGKVRKRKAETTENERLSKRLSLLNLERNGQKLYVPVEQPSRSSTPKLNAPTHPPAEDVMQLDDSKHKVYIYDLDAELSDSGESDDGKLVFLPDIEKHLRESRIPSSLLASGDGDLAGNSQLVLYRVPSSLTVPEEQDSVRKAIIETRARARAKQEQKRQDDVRTSQAAANGVDARDWYQTMADRNVPQSPTDQVTMGVQQEISDEAQEDYDAMDLG
ncbi:hypothetical protein GLAREA_08061 [Glarea lozoyensis ATCC 20868]|uniref:Uncharacterized protein n=2 Tax=Glarea lozoyensis TaxID=101852 RepID=S3CWK9_GLAL2|nr:uncharacterized protein GLAREA_08061 [Glarea lozoyensis ATCC 20868]EHK97391.1 hypothetical protein M7I_6806 [Glarea lozoyensis 74030]EPE24211.1 hypothetical protein GLAREA_08061 [Glarea lozoyensis ATCC 20868]